MLVYIASLPHSGSTLLSLLLAQHPRVVALGEVRLQIDKLRRDPGKAGDGLCGCGKRIRDCSLWGRFLTECAQQATPAEGLSLVVQIARELHGPDTLFVDASKIREPIEEMSASPDFPVKIFHLSRDYRSWIVSSIEMRRRKGKHLRAGWLLGLEGARRWVRENRKLERAISRSPFVSMRLGYEELVLAAPLIWPKLWEFLELPDGGVPRDIGGSHNHIFSGNRMREDSARRTVAYDGRWLKRREWLAASLLMPGLAALDRRWTYSHGLAGGGDKHSIMQMAASHGFEP
jgi:hypothetical protein